jgi:succinate dehydrogenase / fumarate reductase iron-sulfur subunit
MSEKNYEFVVKRKDDNGKESYSSYEVPKDKISTVLEGLIYIKENFDQTLSFRYSCRMEICGSCGMEVNGKPRTACSTIVSQLGTDRVKVDPMKHYEVIKDLVVDMDPFFTKYSEGLPYIIREGEEDYSSEIPQTPEQFKEYEQYSMCIKCGLCMAACPIVGSDEDYMGPAPLAAVLRYNKDNRDQGSKYRLEIVDGDEGTSRCHFVGECTEVCPKGVDPSFAIQRLRMQGVKYELGKFFRRKK